MDQSFNQHYKPARPVSNQTSLHAFKHFEVRNFSNNKYDSLFRSTAGRIRNCFIKAINEHSALPKLIVTILDDDLVKNLKSKIDTYENLHEMTEWLLTEFEKELANYKDMILIKAQREHFPHFLWIASPQHKYFGGKNNELRAIQEKCLAEVVQTKKDMTLLKMIKFWDPSDSNLFLRNEYRFISEGLEKYWASIDAAIKYWDIIISAKIMDKGSISMEKSKVTMYNAGKGSAISFIGIEEIPNGKTSTNHSSQGLNRSKKDTRTDHRVTECLHHLNLVFYVILTNIKNLNISEFISFTNVSLYNTTNVNQFCHLPVS